MSGQTEEGYTRCIDAMAEAARLYMKQHPFAELKFTDFEAQVARDAGRSPDEKVAIIAVLSDCIKRWAANTDTVDFLSAMVEASRGEATFMQARAILQTARGFAFDRATTKLSEEGNWTCVKCQTRLEAATALDMKEGGRPEPGSLVVCSTCGALQQVNAAGNGHEALSQREINQLPKSIRMQLLGLKAKIEHEVARRKARS